MTRALTLVLLLATFAAPAAGQRPRVATKAAPGKLVAMDTAATTVTEARISSAVELVTRLNLTKGEFEATDAFHARLQERLPQGFYAFRILGYCGSDFTYDPDQQTMQLEVNHTDGAEYRLIGDEFPTASAACTRRPAGSYIGQNAFGVKKRIDVYQFTQLGFRSDKYTVRHDDLTFHLSADSARALKPYLATVLVAHPALPASDLPISHASSISEATITAPLEYRGVSVNIFVDQLWAWVYDRRSGQVVAKFNLLTALSPY